MHYMYNNATIITKKKKIGSNLTFRDGKRAARGKINVFARKNFSSLLHCSSEFEILRGN